MAISIGDIVFGLGPDTSKLRKAIRDVLDFGDALDQMAESAEQGGNKQVAAMQRQEAAITSALQKMMNFNQAVRNTQGPKDAIAISQQAFKDLSNEMSRGTLTSLEYQRAQEQFQGQMGRASRIFKDYKAGLTEGSQAGTTFSDRLHNIALAAQLTTGPLSGVAFRITTLSNLLTQGGFATALFVGGLGGAAYAGLKFTESIIKNEESLLRMRLQLFQLSGSMDVVKEDMQFTLAVANQFGVSFQEVAQHFARIELAARGSAIQGNGVRDMFKDLIAYSANFGLTTEKTSALLGVFEHILSKGNIQVRELRTQLSSQIPNAPVLLAKALAGGDEASLDRMAKRGELMSDKTLPKLAKTMLGDTDPTKQVDNLFASQGRLNTAITLFMNALDAATGTSDNYKSGLDRITAGVDFLTKNMTLAISAVIAFGVALVTAVAFPTIISSLAGVVRGVIALGSALASVGALIASGGLLAGLRSMTVAVTALNFATMASPLGWVLRLGLAIAAGVAAFDIFNSSLDTNKDKLLTGSQSNADYIKTWDDMRKSISSVTEGRVKDQQAALLISQQRQIEAKASMEAAAKTLETVSADGGAAAAKSWWTMFILNFKAGQQAMENPDLRVSADPLERAAGVLKGDAAKKLQKARDDFEAAQSLGKDMEKQLQDLMRVQKEQEKQESGQTGRNQDENDRAKRMRLANEELARTISEQNKEFDAMRKGPQELQKVMEEIQLEKTIEGWRKKLEQAGFTAAEAEPKIAKLAASAKQLADIKLADKNFVSWAKFLEEGFQELGKTGVSKFVDAVNAGTLSMKTLRDIGFSVITTLEKKFLELAFVNPLMNSLFGSVSPVFTFGMPGSRPGGLLGSITGGGSGTKHGGSGTTGIRQMNWGMFQGAPRLHEGLMPDEFPAILQRGEEVTPKGGARGGVSFTNTVHQHFNGPPPEDPVKQQMLAEASRRSLESMMDSRISEAMRPGASIWRGRR